MDVGTVRQFSNSAAWAFVLAMPKKAMIAKRQARLRVQGNSRFATLRAAELFLVDKSVMVTISF